MQKNYIESCIKQFEYYKMLGEKTIVQLTEAQLFWQYNPETNSIATIIKHLQGNMLSRWTDFLSSDGEKEWRNRDTEFENEALTREQVLQQWNAGWACLLNALKALTPADLEKEIFIRNQGQTVVDTINRQLGHYPYHVGQIVFIGKMICNENWQSLSIPRGHSRDYNAAKFAQPKHTAHFTDEFLQKEK